MNFEGIEVNSRRFALSVFDHFVKLALKGLINFYFEGERWILREQKLIRVDSLLSVFDHFLKLALKGLINFYVEGDRWILREWKLIRVDSLNIRSKIWRRCLSLLWVLRKRLTCLIKFEKTLLKVIKTNTWTPSNNGLTSFSLGERRQISLLTLSEFKATD